MNAPKGVYSKIRRLITGAMIPLIALATSPVTAAYANTPLAPTHKVVIKRDPNPVKVKARTGPHKLKPVVAKLALSAAPSDLDLSTARVFLEPLIPMVGEQVKGENGALAHAILAFKQKSNIEDVSDFTKFMKQFPNSRWTPSLELNVADLQFQSGYLSRSLAFWKSAWEASKNQKGLDQKAVANHALAKLLLLDTRLGRVPELKQYLAVAKKRGLLGSDEEAYNCAKEGLISMEGAPGRSFKCGPFAVNSLLYVDKPAVGRHPLVDKAASTKCGTNLAQVEQLARQVGLKYQLARREKGTPPAVPSILHWNLDHFAAVTKQIGDRYQIKDPTFGNDGNMCLTLDALDAETDGYCVIPAGAMPNGFRAIDNREASLVWGKGGSNGPCDNYMLAIFACVPLLGLAPGGRSSDANHNDSVATSSAVSDQCSGTCSDTNRAAIGGMARSSIWPNQCNLNVVDVPLTYTAPLGPPISFRLNYNYNETNQPTTFSFTNFGQDWSIDWLSYMTVDPTSSIATIRVPGGGSEVETPSGGVYSPDYLTQDQLVKTGTNAYQNQLPGGTIETYNLADTSSPPHIFLTEVTDPQGNSVLIQYDANYRITSITDAINQVSTVAYVSNTLGNSGFYKVSQITDPFGRTASFTYDSTNTFLTSITDSIGLVSKFDYDTGSSAITALTTPYGTTSFYKYQPGIVSGGHPARGMRVTYPDGSQSVLESWPGDIEQTYSWGREVTVLYPNDPANHVYTHCNTTTWTFNNSTNLMDPIVSSDQRPLESAVSYTYPNQPSPGFTGTTNVPLQISRPICTMAPMTATVGGTITAGDVVSVEFNGNYASYTVQTGNTTTSVASGLAATINSNSYCQSEGITATSFQNVVTISSRATSALATFPSLSGGATETLTMSAVTKQIAHLMLGGTVTTGNVISINFGTNYDSNSFSYTVQTGDTLNSIASGLATAANGNAIFTSLGLTAAAYGSDLVCSSNLQNLITWSNGSSGVTETVYITVRNGTAETTTILSNSLGYPTETIDPIGREFTYTYAANSIDLQQITETQNGDNYVLGNWTYNSQHEPTKYIDGSAQTWQYGYNSSGQPTTATDPNSNVTTATYTGTDTATIGGTKTTGNVLTITAHDAGLSGGQEAVSYTVQSSDTLTTIASGLAAAINADTHLQAIGVTATSASTVITLNSTSTNVTTYTESTSGGATETITFGTNIFGFPTKVQGPLSGSDDITTFTYDNVGRLLTSTDSEGYTLTYSYDNADRPTQTLYPDGSTEQTIYDKLDAVLQKDRIGRWTQDGYNSLRQHVFQTDPLGRKTQYQWCLCGSLANLIDPSGNNTNWSHDIEGRTVQKTYTDQTAVNYTYDPATGRPSSRTDALGQTTNYSYYPDNTVYQVIYTNTVNPTSTVAYTYDPKFSRIATAQNNWGTYTYTYNAYVTNPLGTPITGGGMLEQVQNNVIASSNITYTYDAMGRTTNRSINGSSNSVSWSYDAMSRITQEQNALGTFSYTYVDDTSGSSKGTLRLKSISYPNSQTTNFGWYGNAGDQRLQQITNLNPSGAMLSQFNYTYDSAGEITQWQQQQNGGNLFYNLGYDLAGQLVSAKAGSGSPLPPYSRENYYAYDLASNRTSSQTVSVQTLRVGGSKKTSDVLTLTVTDPALSGGQESVSYTVQSGDTLSTIAAGLATAVNTDTHLQGLGVTANAQSSKTFINIRSVSSNITTYSTSTSGGATETLTFGIFKNGVENATIGGTKTTGDVLTLTVYDPALSGGHQAVTYTVLSTDTLATIATGLKSAINSNSALSTLGVTATAATDTVSITSTSINATTYADSVSGSATETVALASDQNIPATVSIGGSKTTSDVLKMNFFDAGLSGGSETVSYTVLSSDTLTTIATALTSAINADTNLQGIGVSATSSGTLITIVSNSPNLTTYVQSLNNSATETISISRPTYGWEVAAIGGTKTTGDVLTITAYDSALSGGKEVVNYTVVSGDTLTSIATNVAAAINGDSNLSAIGVTATASSTVVSIESLSPNLTTFAESTSTSATETITLAPSTGVMQALYNNANELTNLAPGGTVTFQGTTDKAVNSASIAGQVISIKAAALPAATYSTSLTGVGTETVTIAPYVDSSNSTAQEVSVTVGGTVTAGDTISLTVTDTRLTDGPVTVSYTAKSGDTTSSIANGLLGAIYNNSQLQGNIVENMYTSSNVLYIPVYTSYAVSSTSFESTVTGATPETLTTSTNTNGNVSITVGGTATATNVVYLTVYNTNLSGGQETVSYTVASGNTLNNIATGLTSAINADSHLSGIGVTATSSGAVISVAQAGTTYTASTSGGATETLTMGTDVGGNTAATVGGKVTSGNTLTITAHNALLSGGQEAVIYTVLSTDTLVTIAAGLAAAVNADSHLQTLGVTASNSNAANLAFSKSFLGTGVLAAGAGTANASATDAVPNTKTNGYQVSVPTSSSSTLTFDANGNQTSDGTNSYTWDAENRLLSIIYPGTGNHSDFTYDGLGNRVKIVETRNNAVTSTKIVCWVSSDRAEIRNASGAVTAQFFPLGETISGTSYFYTTDHLGGGFNVRVGFNRLALVAPHSKGFNPEVRPASVREMTNSSGTVEAQYAFDPWGQVTKLQGTLAADMQYAGYYEHAASGLNLTATRAYSASLGRFINRDPINENGDINLFGYVDNDPIDFTDPAGLKRLKGGIYGPGHGVDTPSDPGRACPVKDCVEDPTARDRWPTRAGSGNSDCANGDGYNNCEAPDGTLYNPQGRKICGTGPQTPPANTNT